jgi:hypothetical protein
MSEDHSELTVGGYGNTGIVMPTRPEFFRSIADEANLVNFAQGRVNPGGETERSSQEDFAADLRFLKETLEETAGLSSVCRPGNYLGSFAGINYYAQVGYGFAGVVGIVKNGQDRRITSENVYLLPSDLRQKMLSEVEAYVVDKGHGLDWIYGESPELEVQAVKDMGEIDSSVGIDVVWRMIKEDGHDGYVYGKIFPDEKTGMQLRIISACTHEPPVILSIGTDRSRSEQLLE